MLPYFDLILDQLAKSNPNVATALGTHVHWGYWPDPATADTSFTGFRLAADRMVHEMFTDAGIKRGERVLDAGCGFGGTIDLLNHEQSDLSICGLNIELRQLLRARSIVGPASHNNRITLVAGDASALPFLRSCFDCVLAVECVFHFPSLSGFLKRARHVLGPGGRLVISDFVAGSGSFRLLNVLRIGLSNYSAWRQIYGKTRSVGIDEYERQAKKAGFRLVNVRDVTEETMPTYDVLDRLADEFEREADRFRRANQLGRHASRLNVSRYSLMTFVLD